MAISYVNEVKYLELFQQPYAGHKSVIDRLQDDIQVLKEGDRQKPRYIYGPV